MDSFFARYPDFQYNAGQSPVAQFVRLRETQPEWNQTNPTTNSYRNARKRFLKQWDESTATVADRVWVYFCQFPDLNYNYDTEESNVLPEFERLTALRRWRTGRNHYRQQLAQLQLALGQVPSQAPPASAIGRTKKQPRSATATNPPTGGVSLSNAIDLRSEISPANSRASSPGPVIYTPPLADSPLTLFFSQYQGFQYNPSAPASDEFARLVVHRGWKDGSKQFRKARSRFMGATGEQVLWHLEADDPLFSNANAEYGARSEEGPEPSEAGEEGSKPWERMCQLLDLETAEGVTPKSKTQCKKVLEKIFINIFDFQHFLQLRSGATPEMAQTLTVRRFPTLSALARYTHDEGKKFPKSAAKKHELLRFLLRRVGRY